MARGILIQPIISEKADKQTKKSNQYTFVVEKKANKIEIGKAVAAKFNVTVEAVNTSVMPGKSKTRNTKRGAIQGRIPSYKKAIVTLASGEEINFFGEEEQVGE